MNSMTKHLAFLAPIIFGFAIVGLLTSKDLESDKWILIILFSFSWVAYILRLHALSTDTDKVELGLALIQKLADQDSETFGKSRRDIAVIAKSTLKTLVKSCS